MDFNELIQTGENFAQISFTYSGTPEAGMLAWLDSDEMKTWWRADNVIIEPYPSGMFYISWDEKYESRQHAVYGVIDGLDVENHCIKISKLFYMGPAVKIGPTHLHIELQNRGNGYTRFWMLHTHPHQDQLQKLYNASVYASWPKSFSLLKKYLERTK